MVQLMPLPLTVCYFSKIQIGFAFLVLAHPGSPRQSAFKRVCVCEYLVSLFIVLEDLCFAAVTVPFFIFLQSLLALECHKQRMDGSCVCYSELGI